MTDAEAIVAVQDAFWRASDAVLFHHTTPWELDEALTGWGYGIGPCEAQDLVGLETVLARDPKGRLPILPRMLAEGRLGKIGGVGYYRYPGGGGAVIDPLIEDLIQEEAWFAKVTRCDCAGLALVERMHAAVAPVVTELYCAKGIDVSGCLAQAISFPQGRMDVFQIA